MTDDFIDHIQRMAHSPAYNYVIPGLTSWLIGQPSKTNGCVRMFTMSRTHEEPILPHSHRFDFKCLVLKGAVRNCIWNEIQGQGGDEYEISDVTYEGQLGKHEKTVLRRGRFYKTERVYPAGSEYGMLAEEFHSIFFSKGAMVLFFEGPNRLATSQILEPVIMDKAIPLFRTEDWMFIREGK